MNRKEMVALLRAGEGAIQTAHENWYSPARGVKAISLVEEYGESWPTVLELHQGEVEELMRLAEKIVEPDPGDVVLDGERKLDGVIMLYRTSKGRFAVVLVND